MMRKPAIGLHLASIAAYLDTSDLLKLRQSSRYMLLRSFDQDISQRLCVHLEPDSPLLQPDLSGNYLCWLNTSFYYFGALHLRLTNLNHGRPVLQRILMDAPVVEMSLEDCHCAKIALPKTLRKLRVSNCHGANFLEITGANLEYCKKSPGYRSRMIRFFDGPLGHKDKGGLLKGAFIDPMPRYRRLKGGMRAMRAS